MSREAGQRFCVVKSVAVILNTVRDAVETFDRLAGSSSTSAEWSFLAAMMLSGHKARRIETIRERLEEDLRTAVGRLRMMGGAVAVEELAGAIGDNSPYADEVDEIQENERREIGFATRELLVDRVNRLSAALERLKSGDYGTCTECEEAISSALITWFGDSPRANSIWRELVTIRSACESAQI